MEASKMGCVHDFVTSFTDPSEGHNQKNPPTLKTCLSGSINVPSVHVIHSVMASCCCSHSCPGAHRQKCGRLQLPSRLRSRRTLLLESSDLGHGSDAALKNLPPEAKGEAALRHKTSLCHESSKRRSILTSFCTNTATAFETIVTKFM